MGGLAFILLGMQFFPSCEQYKIQVDNEINNVGYSSLPPSLLPCFEHSHCKLRAGTLSHYVHA